MDVLNNKSEAVLSFFTGMDEMLNLIHQVLKNRTPHLNGEKFLTGKDVCTMLHISPRTLQEWRSKQVIPCIRLKGKILYRQGDIEKALAEHRTTPR
jgi:prophage antirepressor-like protein